MSYLLGGLLVVCAVLLVVALLLVEFMGSEEGAGFSAWLHPRWVVAQQRAEAALRALLTDAEYQQLCANGYLEVASLTQPQRVYRVPRGSGQVLVLEGGRPREYLCLQPAAQNLPQADVVLLHKLLIQADEELYLRTANHIPVLIWDGGW